MKHDTPKDTPAAALRQRAEETFLKKASSLPENPATLSPEELGRTLHELRVHQIELEIQNEELRRAQAELTASQARYFDLYDMAPVGYLTLSDKGLIVQGNLTACTLLGVPRNALASRPFSQFILKEDADIYYLFLKQLLKTGLPQACELRLVKKDGTAFWAQVEATEVRDADGKTTCRIVVSDITERKLQADARELTAHLILLVNAPGDSHYLMSQLTSSLQGWSGCEAVGIRLRDGDDYPYYETRGFPPAFVQAESHLCACGPDGKVLRGAAGNPVLECMCGNVLSGRFDPSKPFFTMRGSFWSNNTTALLASTTVADRQARTRNRCNSEGYESVALIPLRVDQQVLGLLQFNDRRPDRFTPDLIAHFESMADSLAIALERRQGGVALQQAHERLELAQQAAGAGVWDWDVPKEKLSWTPAMCRLFGLDPATAAASFETWRSVVHPDDIKAAEACIGDAMRDHVRLVNDYRIVLPSGDVRWIHALGDTTYDADGRPLQMTGICFDNTERKQMERTRTFLARSSGGIPDEPFFNMLAAFLAKDLGMDFVCIDLLEGDGLMARTLAVWCDGKFEDNVTYALKDTPCGDVVGKTVCCFPASVCQFFPRDQVLQDLRAESYIGTTLWSHDGRPVGLIALISRRPLANLSSAEAVLKLVASRAGGEIERLQAEAALQQSEIKHGKMVANIGDVIVIIDQDGINRYKSPNIEKWFGWRPEEVVGAGALDNVHPEDLDHARGFIGALLREPKAAATTQCRYRCKDGSYKWIEFTGINLLHDPDIRGILGNYQDITERKLAEEELRKKDEQFRTLTTLAPAGIYLSDADGNCLYANPAWCKMAGLQSEEALGPGWARGLHPDDRDRVFAGWNHMVKSRGQWGQEYRFQTRDGKVTWVYGLAAPQYDASGKITQYVGINIDITERKQAEEEHARLQVQLTQAQKMESVGRLAGGVAHDFNNLLMSTMGYTQLCLDKLGPDHPIREYLDEIMIGTERSAELSRQLLAFARKQIVAPKVLDFSEAVSGMLKLLRRLIGEDITMKLTEHTDTWPVKMDPVQIDQILANLAVNARDAIGGVGSITIETSNATFDEAFCAGNAGFVPGDYALLTVTDTGCGMDPETLEHIFEPFFTTKGVGEGTGLGLATVYGIVKQNNGYIHVSSEPGKGTTFKIYLPRHVLAETAQAAVAAPAKPSRGTETILMVEDDKSVRLTTHMFLEDLGYTVLVAEDPEKALALAAQHPGEIHLLITDVIMPGMSGRELAQRLSEFRPAIKRLFISGFTADLIAERGILADGVNFLSKPFGRDVLARKVREVLEP